MKQYLELLKSINENGRYKAPARSGMPGTTSLFGYQFRHDLSKGFPLLTTKKMFFKGLVIELLWFLKGDTNIKFLDENGVKKFWHQDAYNYYLKKYKENNITKELIMTFEEFCRCIEKETYSSLCKNVIATECFDSYIIGDCGFQYGKVWRNWETQKEETFKTGNTYPSGEFEFDTRWKTIDQITRVLKSLKDNPEGRRHIVTAIDPAHDEDLALYWCHALFQFNCRKLTQEERMKYAISKGYLTERDLAFDIVENPNRTIKEQLDDNGVPVYYLDCSLYQRSADVFLGVPFNIASYALLTHMFAKILNMAPGDFVHTFGDVHVYDNHKDQINEQLSRKPLDLPVIELSHDIYWSSFLNDFDAGIKSILDLGWKETFQLKNYNPHPEIEGKLSTGLK
jgi:thymidylate synthase